MYYPGDTVSIIYPISKADGSAPVVTGVPTVIILRLSDQTIILAAAMILVPGSTAVYYYNWQTANQPNTTYIIFVSAVVDGITYNTAYLDTIVLGDSRIQGPVALDATVAKDSTVAKAATTLQASSYVSPQNDPVVLNIQSKVNNLPSNPASTTDVGAVLAAITALTNFQEGRWIVDKVNNLLTVTDPVGNTLVTYNLVNTDSMSSRIPV